MSTIDKTNSHIERIKGKKSDYCENKKSEFLV